MTIKRSSFGSARKWLWGRPCLRKRYVQHYYKDPADWLEFDTTIDYGNRYCKGFFWKYPKVAKSLLEDYRATNDSKVDSIIDFIVNGKSKILILNGGRGAGKTCLSMFIADEIHKRHENLNIAFIGEGLDEKAFPDWIKIKDSAEKVKNAIAIIDEASIKFSARRSMEDANVALSQLVAISRHQNLTIIFLTQHLKLMDINAWRMRSAVFYLMGVDSFANEKGKSDFEKTHLKMRLMMRPREVGECLFDLAEHHRLFTFKFQPPEWWNDGISKVFKNFNPHEEMIKRKIEKAKMKQRQKIELFKQKQEIMAEAYAKKGIKQINVKGEDTDNPFG